jgi:hypothetical protein
MSVGILRSGGATANTAEAGAVLSAGTLLVTVLTAAVALTVTAGGAVSATLTASTVAGGAASGASRLGVGDGDNLSGEVEPLAEVSETLVGEGVVVPLPRELGLDVALRGERLHGLDDLKVGDGGEVGVGGAVELLGGDEDALLEELLVDLDRSVDGRLSTSAGARVSARNRWG